MSYYTSAAPRAVQRPGVRACFWIGETFLASQTSIFPNSVFFICEEKGIFLCDRERGTFRDLLALFTRNAPAGNRKKLILPVTWLLPPPIGTIAFEAQGLLGTGVEHRVCL